jgi:hypothetical protein
MSRNGSGTYSLPAGNPVVTQTTISSSWANNTMNDLAAALTDSVAADGQTPMTGNLDLNTHKIVNLVAGSAAGDGGFWGVPGGCPRELNPICVPSGEQRGGTSLRSLAAMGLPRGACHEGLERFRPVRRLPRGIPSAYRVCACSCRKASRG